NDAGMLLGFRQVDAADARVMMRAADHLEVQQSRNGPVGEIGRGSGDMAASINPKPRLADLLEAVRALVGKVGLTDLHRVLLSRCTDGIGARRRKDRLDDRLVARAAADVAGDRVYDVLAGW